MPKGGGGPRVAQSLEEVTVYIFWYLAKINTWQCYSCHLKLFETWPFFGLWPLFRRSDEEVHRSGEEVTVDTFCCLTPTNTLAVSVLPFKIVQNLTKFLTFFDLRPLFRRSDEEVTVDFFVVWPRLTHWQCYIYHFTLFAIWPFRWRGHCGHFLMFDPTNTLAVLVLPFQIVQNLTPFFDLSDLKWPQVKFIFIILKDNVKLLHVYKWHDNH